MTWTIDIVRRTATLQNGVVIKFTVPPRKPVYVHALTVPDGQDLYGLLEVAPELDVPPRLAMYFARNPGLTGRLAVEAAQAFIVKLKEQAECADSSTAAH